MDLKFCEFLRKIISWVNLFGIYYKQNLKYEQFMLIISNSNVHVNGFFFYTLMDSF